MSAMWPTGKFTQPYIVRGYGYQMNPFTHVWSLHAGVDIAASGGQGRGAAVHAAEDATVVFSGLSGSTTSGYGWLVVLRAANNRYYLYAHMDGRGMPRNGARVRQGQVIGYVGSSGGSTGPHMHFGTGIGGYSYAHLSDPIPFMNTLNPAGGGGELIDESEEEMAGIKYYWKDEVQVEYGIFGEEQPGGFEVSTDVNTGSAWGRLYGKPNGAPWAKLSRAQWIKLQDESRVQNERWASQFKNNPAAAQFDYDRLGASVAKAIPQATIEVDVPSASAIGQAVREAIIKD